MHLRLASANDIEEIIKLGSARELLTQDIVMRHLWVAEFSGCIKGVAAITDIQTLDYRQTGLNIDNPAIVIRRLAVSADFRRQGIAKALLAHSEKIAAARGIRQLWADTDRENSAGRKLFRKAGYHYAGDITYPDSPGLIFSCYCKFRIQGPRVHLV